MTVRGIELSVVLVVQVQCGVCLKVFAQAWSEKGRDDYKYILDTLDSEVAEVDWGGVCHLSRY